MGPGRHDSATRPLRLASIGMVLAVGVSGCLETTGSSTGLTPSVRAHYEDLLNTARVVGSSEEQISVIEESLESGRRIVFEQYKQAKEAEIACVEELGFDIVEREETSHGAWTEITYLFGGIPQSDELDTLVDEADACMDRHARFIELAYQTAPSIEERDELRNAHREELLACLKRDGVAVNEDSEWADLVRADREHPRPAEDQNCFEELGLIDMG